MPKIDTLIKDMEDTILGLNGWDHLISLGMGDRIADIASSRFNHLEKRGVDLWFYAIKNNSSRHN